jgi:hypothetical protein
MQRRFVAAILGLVAWHGTIVSARAQEDAPGVKPAVAAAVEVASLPTDPAFDRYVDMDLLADAWQDKDAGLLTDLALAMAEGERILQRPRRGISADDVFAGAIKSAAELRDGAGLDRLTKVLGNLKRTDLLAQASTARRLASASRAVDPGLAVQADAISPAAFFDMKSMLEDIASAKIAGDRKELRELSKDIAEMSELTDAQRKSLTRVAAEAIEMLPTENDPATSALNKLLDESRGGRGGGGGGGRSGGHASSGGHSSSSRASSGSSRASSGRSSGSGSRSSGSTGRTSGSSMARTGSGTSRTTGGTSASASGSTGRTSGSTGSSSRTTRPTGTASASNTSGTGKTGSGTSGSSTGKTSGGTSGTGNKTGSNSTASSKNTSNSASNRGTGNRGNGNRGNANRGNRGPGLYLNARNRGYFRNLAYVAGRRSFLYTGRDAIYFSDDFSLEPGDEILRVGSYCCCNTRFNLDQLIDMAVDDGNPVMQVRDCRSGEIVEVALDGGDSGAPDAGGDDAGS